MVLLREIMLGEYLCSDACWSNTVIICLKKTSKAALGEKLFGKRICLTKNVIRVKFEFIIFEKFVLPRKNLSFQNNLVLNQGICVSISHYVLLMKWNLKLGTFSFPHLKLFSNIEVLWKVKIKCVTGNLLNISGNFLNDKKAKSNYIWQHPTWKNVEAGVLQGSILGPPIFLTYKNGISDNLVLKWGKVA